MSENRLAFANQLRGVACCMVLAAHYLVVVQVLRPAVSWVVGAPPIEGPVPAIAGWVQHLPVDVGATAVAIFFLISGFVIPFSLEGLTAARFLSARAWRISPTFWAALAVGGLTVAASGAFWHRPLPYGWPDYLLNGTLAQSWVGRQTVDWVSWTLSVEVKFYLLAALCRASLRAAPFRTALGWAAGALLLNVLVRHGALPASPEFASEASFLPFVLAGTLFHAHLSRRLSGPRLAAGTLALCAAATLCWWAGPQSPEAAARGASMLAGLGIFGASYACRQRFRPNRLLDYLATISYPLYLLHALAGFPAVSFLMLEVRLPYAAAAAAALAWVVALASLLHVAVERPTMLLGRRLARARRPALPSRSLA